MATTHRELSFFRKYWLQEITATRKEDQENKKKKIET